MRRALPVVIVLMLGGAVLAAETRVVVPTFSATRQVEAGTAEVLTELLLEALLTRHGLRALGPSDLNEMLSHEQQKQLIGCSDDSCMAQIGGALGARHLIAGQVGKLGKLHILTLKLIDTREAKVANRASLKLEAIEDAADAIGPMTDTLLGSKPRAPKGVPTFAASEPPKRIEVKDPRIYCKEVKAYVSRLSDGRYEDALLQERRALLEDLFRTRFQRDFDEKRGCLWHYDGRLVGQLKRAVLMAGDAGQASDTRGRLAEWNEMTRNLKVLVEAWQIGLEQEKHGGQRPHELPFSVNAGPLSEAEETAAVKQYRKSYKAAQKTVSQAIAALQKKNQKRFEALFVPRDPERGRTKPASVYQNYRGRIDNGFTLDACPLFVLPASEIEYRARMLKKKHELIGCIRRFNDSFAGQDKIFLKRHGGRWRIDRW